MDSQSCTGSGPQFALSSKIGGRGTQPMPHLSIEPFASHDSHMSLRELPGMTPFVGIISHIPPVASPSIIPRPNGSPNTQTPPEWLVQSSKAFQFEPSSEPCPPFIGSFGWCIYRCGSVAAFRGSRPSQLDGWMGRMGRGLIATATKVWRCFGTEMVSNLVQVQAFAFNCGEIPLPRKLHFDFAEGVAQTHFLSQGAIGNTSIFLQRTLRYFGRSWAPSMWM